MRCRNIRQRAKRQIERLIIVKQRLIGKYRQMHRRERIYVERYSQEHSESDSVNLIDRR